MPRVKVFKDARVLREITATLTYADTTAFEMFILPENARIVGWILNVRTAFSGGTATLDVGTSSDGDYYIDGADISSVGQAIPSTTVKKPGEEPTTIAPVYATVGAGNTAGSAEVTCLFTMEQETPMA
jgi:hypothetical protein